MARGQDFDFLTAITKEFTKGNAGSGAIAARLAEQNAEREEERRKVAEVVSAGQFPVCELIETEGHALAVAIRRAVSYSDEEEESVGTGIAIIQCRQCGVMRKWNPAGMPPCGQPCV